ncbi:MAG: biotin--[acetyl-CoA-carboxylase] ligase [Flavobacteriaceae bacterium]|nr:biotin--[acetyl-CoA-carboxylase] ligase [Flavobacteriaceae bacterium]|tara:strand:- start:3177 stop:3905 length:729 start_codon:yes stop_codon:yes gene_type:complete
MKIIKLDAIDSTNSYLKKLLNKESLDDLTVVVSKHQTQGKGRNGKVWVNKHSLNLAFSIYKRFSNFDIDKKFMLNVISSISVSETLKKYNLCDLTVKWPNDIMAGNKKISGILIENNIIGNRIKYSVIGIGININQSEFKNLPNATSIFIETGKLNSVERLTNELQKTLEKNFDKFKTNEDELLNIYNSLLYGKNEISNFLTNNTSKLQGEIIKVTKNGKITIKELNQQFSKYADSEIKLII